jgi:hypothetical protein
MGIDHRCRCETISPCPCQDCSTWPCRVGELECIYQPANALNINKTGADTDTLRKVEAHIQASFHGGLPPHLLPNATSLEYVPGSGQSRIFVSSYSDFCRLEPVKIQAILRHRLILVHGHTFEHNYGWDLPSLGRLYDVDKKVSVLGKSLFPFVNQLNLIGI